MLAAARGSFTRPPAAQCLRPLPAVPPRSQLAQTCQLAQGQSTNAVVTQLVLLRVLARWDGMVDRLPSWLEHSPSP